MPSNAEIVRLLQLDPGPRTEAPTEYWYWGPGALEKAISESESFYLKDKTKWWDNYEWEDSIIIKNYDGKMPLKILCRIIDYMPYKAEVRWSYVEINSPKVYIISKYPPEHFWKKDTNDYNRIKRRVATIYEFIR